MSTKEKKEFIISTNSISIVDLSNSGIKELRDGLTLDMIQNKFSWLLKAKIKDAILGLFENNLIWYNGTWIDGTWINGIWKDGIWLKGIWEYGIWKSGIWLKGTWLNGTWIDGIWINGIRKDGKGRPSNV